MTAPATQTIRIATRASRLALWQAEHIAALLRAAAPQISVEIVTVSTLGDRDLSGPLKDFGGQGVFTREVQKVVLDRRAEIAVHSLKDLPTEIVPGLHLAGVPIRGPVGDALILPIGSTAGSFTGLPPKARIGTGSVRRQAQLLHHRPDLTFLDIRGNLETRLRKLDDGEYDALILAVAGMERLNLGHRLTERLGPPLLFPAVGQGALGIECRIDDALTTAVLQQITDPDTFAAVTAERSVLAALRAGCHAPLGVSTQIKDGQLELAAVVLSADGMTRLHAEAHGPATAAAEIGLEVVAQLRTQNVEAVMNPAVS